MVSQMDATVLLRQQALSHPASHKLMFKNKTRMTVISRRALPNMDIEGTMQCGPFCSAAAGARMRTRLAMSARFRDTVAGLYSRAGQYE